MRVGLRPSRRGRPAPSATEPGEMLTSRDNRWLKTFRTALRQPEPEGGLIGVEGVRLVKEALGSGRRMRALLVGASGERHVAALKAEAESLGGQVNVLHTTDRLFASVAGTETPQGVAALLEAPSWTFDDLLRGGVPLIVVLVGVQDPGNVGTALRSAEAFGATGAIATRGTAHPWSPNAVRASAGSALRLPLLNGMAAPVVLAQLRVAGLKVFAAHSGQLTGRSSNTEVLFPEKADLRGPAAILVGNEGAGLPPEVERAADALLRIPMAGAVESLNAGVAASLLLYEAGRQRGVFA
jgi:TrmH family RNA methyltransferase